MSRVRLAVAVGVAAAAASAGATAAGPPALPLAQVDVSHRSGAQAETMVAVSPTDPRVLLAASNQVWGAPARTGAARGRVKRGAYLRPGTLAYTSVDGGASWTASAPFPSERGRCAIGDPVTAIDDAGRQLIGYLVVPCSAGDDDRDVALYVSHRRDPATPWTVSRVTRPAVRSNDKPAIAWDTTPASPHHGRAYLAWTRVTSGRRLDVVISHSDDGGATWTAPAAVEPPRARRSTFFVSLAVSPVGDVYAAWTTSARTIEVARSADGGATFSAAVDVDAVPSLPGSLSSPCLYRGQEIPAQPRRCVSVNPSVVASASRVYVTYAAAGADGHEQDVRVAAFDPALAQVRAPVQVNPGDGAVVSDQFEPAAALDPASGLLWVCFYDSTGDASRRTVRYACAVSRDGVTWSASLAVASVRSNENGRLARSFEFGDYQGLVVGSDGVAHPVWTDARDLRLRGEEIYTTTLVAANLGY